MYFSFFSIFLYSLSLILVFLINLKVPQLLRQARQYSPPETRERHSHLRLCRKALLRCSHCPKQALTLRLRPLRWQCAHCALMRRISRSGLKCSTGCAVRGRWADRISLSWTTDSEATEHIFRFHILREQRPIITTHPLSRSRSQLRAIMFRRPSRDIWSCSSRAAEQTVQDR